MTQPLGYGSWRALIKSVAILVLALLALDLGDTWCDPLTLPAAGPAITVPQAGQADACSDTCVPDCFCCSTSVPAAHMALVWGPVPSTDAPVLRSAQTSSGFIHPLDHVPIATL